MAQASRSAQIEKLHKVLRKHYKPVAIDQQRSVLEHLLFACLLEDAGYEAAETALAALVHTFFDWNEVRVTSISELCEVMAMLPDPRSAAQRIKRVLQAIFEKTYCFDLEDRRKKNLGETQKWLRDLGATPFVVSYVTQAALGGHSIGLDASTMRVMQIVDLASEKDVAEHSVPGLERAIPKSKGVEFASLLHQLGADFAANPFAPRIREMLVEINPTAAERMPKRRSPKPVVVQPRQSAAGEQPSEKPRKGKSVEEKPAEEKLAAGTPAEGKTPEGKAAEGKAAEGKPGKAEPKGGADKAERPAAKSGKPAQPSKTEPQGKSKGRAEKPTEEKPQAAGGKKPKAAGKPPADEKQKKAAVLTKRKPR